MEMYAARKGWDIGDVEVALRLHPRRARLPDPLPARRCASPTDLTDEQVERLRVIAAKCPVHRTLDGEVMFDERVERVTLAQLTSRARCARSCSTPRRAAQLDVHGRIDAAVLVPLFVARRRAARVFTRRRDDLRRHAGEISFPGGRQDDGEDDLRATALREAEEEIGLPADARRARRRAAADADDRHELRRLSVRRADRARPRLDAVSAAEVDEVLELPLRALRAGYERRRLLRRGIPFRTDVYVVGDHLIWGATARILGDLLERIPAELL